MFCVITFKRSIPGVIKAILWDNDGVLVDTEELYFQAGREVLSEAGIALTREMFIEQSLKKGLSVFDFLPDQDPAIIARLRTKRNARYSQMLRQGVRICDGVRDVLTALHGRLCMGVVTGSRREHFEVIHAQTHLLPFFDFVVVREDYDRSKPDPDAYLTAMRLHGLSPEECVVVEDTERGCKAAAAAGLRVFIAPHELAQHGDFSSAYKRLNHLREVVGEIERLI